MPKDNGPQTVKDLLQWAVLFLGKESRIETELLLAEVTGYSRARLLAYPEKIAAPGTVRLFSELIERRKAGEPLQYLLGRQNFMGLDFIVNPSVLIPRSDTEVVVEEAIKTAKETAGPVKLLDLCTGSGAIAVSIAKYVPSAEVIGVDISAEALKVARLNAEANGVGDKVTFICGDLFAYVQKLPFNIIVSNPPYISTAEMPDLPEDVKKEPRLALWGGEDGLDFYRRIVNAAGAFLSKPGHLLMEIGWQQGPAVLNLFTRAGFVNCQILKDWSGNERVVKGTLYS
ncbi:MAG: peptide chain release factor N(5)-glutamine methyltransferase [Peptococcaceae bacterium]